MCTLLKTIKLYGQSCPKVCVEEGGGGGGNPSPCAVPVGRASFSVVTCAHCPSNSLQTDARLLPSVGDVCASRESPPTNRRRRKTQASRWHGPGAHRMFAPSQQAAFGGAPGPKNTKKETTKNTKISPAHSLLRSISCEVHLWPVRGFARASCCTAQGRSPTTFIWRANSTSYYTAFYELVRKSLWIASCTESSLDLARNFPTLTLPLPFKTFKWDNHIGPMLL